MTTRPWPARLLALAGGLVVIAFIATGVSRLSVSTDYDAFLPRDDAAARDLREVASSFGGDPVVVLLESAEPGGLLDETRLPGLLELEGRLAALPDVAVVYGPATTLNQTAIQIQDLLAAISGYRDGLEEAERSKALERFERRYGALVVQGMPAGLPTLRNEGFVRTVVFGPDGEPRPQWRQFVPDQHAIALLVRPREGLDQAATERLSEQVRTAVEESSDVLQPRAVTITGAPVLVSELARQVRTEVPLLGGGAFTVVGLCLLIAPWRRGVRGRLLPLVPMGLSIGTTLACFGWLDHSLSLGAVVFLPVLLGLGSYYPVYLAQRQHRRMVLTVAAAAAVAFLSLTFSPLPFVRDLGIAVALGIGFVTMFSLVLTVLFPARSAPEVRRGDGAPLAIPPRRVSRSVAGVLAAAALLPAIGGWVLLPTIPVETNPATLFRGVDGYDAATAVQDRLGFAGELDVVLDGPDVLTPEALAWLRKTEEQVLVEHGDSLQPVASPGQLLGFLGPEPTADQIDAAMRLLPAYVTGSVVTVSRDRAVIAFGADLDDFEEQRDTVTDLRVHLAAPPEGYDARVSGIPVAAVRGYDLVSRDRHLANVLGILAAGAVLLVGLRRRSDALRAVLAAGLATGWGFLLLSLTGSSLNPLTLALGSLTAAIGCEFTVLLVAARRDGDARLRISVRLAAALSAAGYAVLAFSSLDVIRQFGLVLVGSVALALGAAHLVSVLTTVAVVRARAPATAPHPTREPELTGVNR